MDQIKQAIRYFLSDGKNHTVEEVKAEIARLIGGEMKPGEVDGIYGELLRDTIVSQIIELPNGIIKSWVKAI